MPTSENYGSKFRMFEIADVSCTAQMRETEKQSSAYSQGGN